MFLFIMIDLHVYYSSLFICLIFDLLFDFIYYITFGSTLVFTFLRKKKCFKKSGMPLWFTSLHVVYFQFQNSEHVS